MNYLRTKIHFKFSARENEENLKSSMKWIKSHHTNTVTTVSSEFGTISTNVVKDTFGIKFNRFSACTMNVQSGVCGIVLPRIDTDVSQVAMAAVGIELTQPSLVLTGCRRHRNLQTSPGTGKFSYTVASAPGRFGRLGYLTSCRSELSDF